MNTPLLNIKDLRAVVNMAHEIENGATSIDRKVSDHGDQTRRRAITRRKTRQGAQPVAPSGTSAGAGRLSRQDNRRERHHRRCSHQHKAMVYRLE